MSLIRRINLNLPPTQGYFYQDAAGVIHRGTNWASVVKRVEVYRRDNKMPPGDPETEVVEQAISREPGLKVAPRGSGPRRPVAPRPPPPPPKPPSVKARVINWLGQTAKRKAELQFVDAALHDGRIAQCVGCPQRQDDFPSGCSSCQKALSGFRTEILGRRPTPGPNGCRVLGEDPKTASWLEIPAVSNDALPPTCWRKKTL